jgi:hypothetical protein
MRYFLSGVAVAALLSVATTASAQGLGDNVANQLNAQELGRLSGPSGAPGPMGPGYGAPGYGPPGYGPAGYPPMQYGAPGYLPPGGYPPSGYRSDWGPPRPY